MPEPAPNTSNASTDGDQAVQILIDNVTRNMVPTDRAPRYRSAWHDLQEYKASLGLDGLTTSNHVFALMAKKHSDGLWTSPKTLWTNYSMMRTMIRIREGHSIDDGTANICEIWLKGLSRVHKPKQSLQFTKEDVATYLTCVGINAPIDMKLLLIFGLNLGLWTADLKKLQWRHIEQKPEGLRVTVDWATKTDQGARGNWYIIAKEDDPRVCGPTLSTSTKRSCKKQTR